MPALYDEFVGEVDSTSESEARALSLEAFEQSSERLTKSDEERISIANELRTKIKMIADTLLAQADEQNAPNPPNPTDEQEQHS